MEAARLGNGERRRRVGHSQTVVNRSGERLSGPVVDVHCGNCGTDSIQTRVCDPEGYLDITVLRCPQCGRGWNLLWVRRDGQLVSLGWNAIVWG